MRKTDPSAKTWEQQDGYEKQSETLGFLDWASPWAVLCFVVVMLLQCWKVRHNPYSAIFHKWPFGNIQIYSSDHSFLSSQFPAENYMTGEPDTSIWSTGIEERFEMYLAKMSLRPLRGKCPWRWQSLALIWKWSLSELPTTYRKVENITRFVLSWEYLIGALKNNA